MPKKSSILEVEDNVNGTRVDQLFKAVENANLDELKNLLKDDKKDAISRNSDGETLLYKASFLGHLKIVEYLVEITKSKLIDMDDTEFFENERRASSLHAASQEGKNDVVEFLIKNGANLGNIHNIKYRRFHW